MKGCLFEANLERQRQQKSLPTSWLVLVWGLELERVEGSLYTLYCVFKNIPFKLYNYVLAKILENGAKVIEKVTPGFKNHMRKLENLGKQRKVQKVNGLHLSKKYILPVKTYTKDLLNIAFNYSCESLPNYLCYF